MIQDHKMYSLYEQNFRYVIVLAFIPKGREYYGRGKGDVWVGIGDIERAVGIP